MRRNHPDIASAMSCVGGTAIREAGDLRAAGRDEEDVLGMTMLAGLHIGIALAFADPDRARECEEWLNVNVTGPEGTARVVEHLRAPLVN